MSEPSKLSKRLERTRQKIELLQAQRQLRMLESFERGQRLPVRLPKAQQNLQESSSEAWQWVSGYQDVIDRFNGTDRDFIFPFSTAMDRRYGENWPFWRTWQEHARLRAASRLIWTLSPLASGAISALTSYVVGEGMQTKIAGKDKDVAKELVAAVQAVVDSIIDRNDWMTMQQECFTRARRDGEFFLRDFPQDDGMTLFRIVDPEQIMEPPGMSREEASFGIITDPDDLLDIRGYWWAPRGVPSLGEYLPSSEVLHVKENVDGIIKRGLPDFAFDTQQLYKTVNRLLINMGQGASIQSAIAFVRQHKNVDTASIEAFVNAQGDYSETRPFTGVQQTIQRLEGGSVIDMDANQDFVKSPGADNVSGFTQVVQALLRAVATRWNAPEWIVSADASNNNMASSMVAESPFVKTCKRFQHRYARAFKHVIVHALRHYCRVRGGLRVGMSKYTWATLSQLIDVQVVPPTVETRNRQEEAMVNRTYVELGVKSRKTIATELGLDWDTEQQNNDEYDKAHPQGGQGGAGGNPLAAMMGGGGDQPPDASPPDEPQPPDDGGDDNTNQPPQDDNEDFSDLEGFLDSIDLNESRRSTLNQFADTEIHSAMHTQILFDPAKTIFSEGEWVNSVLNQPAVTPLIESRQTSSLTELEAFASQLPVDERLSYIRQALLEGRGIDKLGRVICWNDKGKRIPCNQEKSETSHKDRQRANEGLQKLMAAPHAVTPKDAESVAKALKHLAHDELAALKKQHGLRASGKKEELINRLVGAASKILTQRQQYERQARAEGVPPAYVNSIAQQNYKIGAGYVREARKLIWAARDYYEGMTGKKLRIMRANGRMDPSSIPELELIARGLKTQFPGFLNPDEMADDTENARVLFDLLVTGGPAMPDRGEMYKQAIEQAKYEAKKAEDEVPFDMEGLGDGSEALPVDNQEHEPSGADSGSVLGDSTGTQEVGIGAGDEEIGDEAATGRGGVSDDISTPDVTPDKPKKNEAPTVKGKKITDPVTHIKSVLDANDVGAAAEILKGMSKQQVYDLYNNLFGSRPYNKTRGEMVADMEKSLSHLTYEARKARFERDTAPQPLSDQRKADLDHYYKPGGPGGTVGVSGHSIMLKDGKLEQIGGYGPSTEVTFNQAIATLRDMAAQGRISGLADIQNWRNGKTYEVTKPEQAATELEYIRDKWYPQLKEEQPQPVLSTVIPDGVRRTLKQSIDSLGRYQDALESGRQTDRQFQGEGRYEWDAVINQKIDLREPGQIATFRELAKENGVDAVAVLDELGYKLPELSEAGKAYGRDDIARRDQRGVAVADSERYAAGFTGTDALGREWRDGKLVAKKEDDNVNKPARPDQSAIINQQHSANSIRKRLGKPPLEFELRLIPVDSIKPSQTGEDYDNASSRELARKTKGGKQSDRIEDNYPVAVDENGEIIDGNHRHAAAKINGVKDIWALVPKQDGLDVGTSTQEPVGAKEENTSTPDASPTTIDTSVVTPPEPGFSGKDNNGHCWDQGVMVKCPDESSTEQFSHSSATSPAVAPTMNSNQPVPASGWTGVSTSKPQEVTTDEPATTGRNTDGGRADHDGTDVQRDVGNAARKPSGERIVTARTDLVKPADPGLVPERIREHLNEHQIQGVASAIRAMDQHGGFLLADGTGVGKTRQQIAIAQIYAGQGKKVLIVTKSEVIKPDWAKSKITGSFAHDSAAMGVNIKLNKGKDAIGSGEIHVTTYDRLSDIKKQVDKDTVILFDESHSLKNWGSARSKHGYEMSKVADKVMYATATPADKPLHIAHLFRAKIFGKGSWEDTYTRLGMIQKDIYTPQGVIKQWQINPKVGSKEVYRRMAGLFDRLTADGLMLKREISFDGVDVNFKRVDLPPEAHEAMRRVEEEVTKQGAANSGLQKALILMHQRRQQEPFKVPFAVDMAKQEIAAGRQVVIFASRVNESSVGSDDEGENPAVSSEGTAKLLRQALEQAGIPADQIADLHGGVTPAKRAKAVDAFQAGKAKVIVATVESGGTGINLDDTSGDKPRTLIMLTPPLGAVDNMQAAGRVWRLKTQSLPKIQYLFGDTEVDDWNASLIAGKMKMLGAAVAGQIAAHLDIPQDLDDEDNVEIRSGEEVEPYDWPTLVRTPQEQAEYDAANTPVKITGKTFDIKEKIKHLAKGKAKPDDSDGVFGWIVPKHVADQLRDIKGLKFSDTPKPTPEPTKPVGVAVAATSSPGVTANPVDVSPEPTPKLATKKVTTSRGDRHVITFSPGQSFWNARKANKLPDSVSVRKNDRTGQWEATIWGSSPEDANNVAATLMEKGWMPPDSDFNGVDNQGREWKLGRIVGAPVLPEHEPITPERKQAVHMALKHLADSDPDKAREINGIGYNKFDGEMGARLANLPELTDAQARSAIKMLAKYKRQLGDELHKVVQGK